MEVSGESKHPIGTRYRSIVTPLHRLLGKDKCLCSKLEELYLLILQILFQTRKISTLREPESFRPFLEVIDMRLDGEFNLSPNSRWIFTEQRHIGMCCRGCDQLKMSRLLEISESREYIALICFEIVFKVLIDGL